MLSVSSIALSNDPLPADRAVITVDGQQQNLILAACGRGTAPGTTKPALRRRNEDGVAPDGWRGGAPAGQINTPENVLSGAPGDG